MRTGIMKLILPPEDKIFFSIFQESSSNCLETAKLYSEIIHSTVTNEKVNRASELKSRSNKLTKECLHRLHQTFITPFDREDIQHLNQLHNRITKRIVKASFNLQVYRLNQYNDFMIKQSELLVQATEQLVKTVSNFSSSKSTLIKDVSECNSIMKEIESRGDEVLYMAMDELFSGKHEALEVIKLRDIYKDIESAMDTCFAVSDSIVNIVLKNS